MQKIMFGLCNCGCGEKTKPAPVTSKNKDWIKGKPLDYVFNHHGRKKRMYHINPNTGCWEWLLYIMPCGYGMKRRGDRMMLAHRFIYEKEYGPIDAGLELDHLCKNRACVNPDHLEIVSRIENIRRSNKTKLNESKVKEIRGMLSCGINKKKIAENFKLTVGAIRFIELGKNWKQEQLVWNSK